MQKVLLIRSRTNSYKYKVHAEGQQLIVLGFDTEPFRQLNTMDGFVIRSKRKNSASSKNSVPLETQSHSQDKQSHVSTEGKWSQRDCHRSPPKKIKTEISKQSNEDLKEETTDINCPKQENNSTNGSMQNISLPAMKDNLSWRRIRGENLNCDYCKLLSKSKADELLRICEESLTYNSGRLAQVQMFGQWRDIPRKQVAFGDPGLSYNFSGNEVPARPWLPVIETIRDHITEITGQRFNFVLVNRYENGNDHMGEHRDDEKDLVRTSPIASLSLGQPRDFVFKHAASRGKGASRKIPPVTVELEHGSLLMMNYPTNVHWYHALPKRKRALGVRINMTFRDFVVPKAKST